MAKISRLSLGRLHLAVRPKQALMSLSAEGNMMGGGCGKCLLLNQIMNHIQMIITNVAICLQSGGLTLQFLAQL
jgi:hypothetical protein